jgi:hypothetical protein
MVRNKRKRIKIITRKIYPKLFAFTLSFQDYFKENFFLTNNEEVVIIYFAEIQSEMLITNYKFSLSIYNLFLINPFKKLWKKSSKSRTKSGII